MSGDGGCSQSNNYPGSLDVITVRRIVANVLTWPLACALAHLTPSLVTPQLPGVKLSDVPGRCSASWFRSLVTSIHYRQAGSSLALRLCSIISDISCTMRGAAAVTCGLRESPPATDAVSLAATLRRWAGWPACLLPVHRLNR